MAKTNPVVHAYNSGKREAILKYRQELLTYLEQKYMDPAVERGSERGKTILEITREISELLKV